MSTFYLLPPRSLLQERVAAFLGGVFPGLTWNSTLCADLAEQIGAAADRPDVFVVYREDLPEEADPRAVLCDAFGAEAGDEVVEVRVGPRPGEWTAQRWRVAG